MAIIIDKTQNLNNKEEVVMEKKEIKMKAEEWGKVVAEAIDNYCQTNSQKKVNDLKTQIENGASSMFETIKKGLKHAAEDMRFYQPDCKSADKCDELADEVDGSVKEAKELNLLDMLIDLVKAIGRKLFALVKGTIFFTFDTAFIVGGGLLDIVIKVADAFIRDIVNPVIKA